MTWLLPVDEGLPDVKEGKMYHDMYRHIKPLGVSTNDKSTSLTIDTPP